MTAESNKLLIHRLIDASNRHDADAQAELYSEDATNHGRPAGREGLRQIFRCLYATFPDWHFELGKMAAEGDVVMAAMAMTGTHAAAPELPVLGGLLVNVPPTGRRVRVQHFHLYRVRESLIVEHLATRDDLGMMQQLGLLPAVEHSAGDLSRRAHPHG